MQESNPLLTVSLKSAVSKWLENGDNVSERLIHEMIMDTIIASNLWTDRTFSNGYASLAGHQQKLSAVANNEPNKSKAKSK